MAKLVFIIYLESVTLANVSGDVGGSKVLSIYRNFSPADNVFRTQKIIQ